MQKRSKKSLFIMVDGIDGSGKTTIIEAWKKWLRGKKMAVFDLQEYWKKHNTFPEERDFASFDVIISSEPTSVWVGRAIRDEIIRDGKGYSGRDTALAFSLDRQILYTRVIIPALRQGKIVIQDRGISTSIIYQPVSEGGIRLRELVKFSGNILAMKFVPDFLIIALLDPKEALKRLAKRFKKDESIFENFDFMCKIDARFKASWFRRFFESRGASMVYLATKSSKRIVGSQASAILEKLLINHKFV